MMDLARSIALFSIAFALILGSVTLKRDPPETPAPVAISTISFSYTCGVGRNPPRIEARCRWVKERAFLPRASVIPYVDYNRFYVTEWSTLKIDVLFDDGSRETLAGPVTVSDMPAMNGQSLSIGFKSGESTVQMDRQEQR